MWSALCTRVKHIVLDGAHPFPESIRIVGRNGTWQHAIVSHVVAKTFGDDIRVELTGDSDDDKIRLWVDDDATPIVGWMTVVRYLGRLFRTYPTHPAYGAMIDTSLERLDQLLCLFTERNHECAVALLQAIDNHLEVGGCAYMEEMSTESVADVCWAAAVLFHMAEDEVPWAELHLASAWWFDVRGMCEW